MLGTKGLMERNAAEVMSKRLVTVRWDDSVRKAYQLMQDRQIRHLPVCDVKGEVIGILSDRDLQRAMKPNVEIVRDFEEGVEFEESHLAKDFMTWPVRAIDGEVPVVDVAQRMLSEKVSAFIVVEHKQAVGIVTTDDLLKLLVRLLQKEPSQLRMSLATALWA